MESVNYICRLCLCEPLHLISLFEHDGIKIVESLTSIKIQKDDNLPSKACMECWQNINLAYRIQKYIKESDKRLRLMNRYKAARNVRLLRLNAENKGEFIDPSELLRLNPKNIVEGSKNVSKLLPLNKKITVEKSKDSSELLHLNTVEESKDSSKLLRVTYLNTKNLNKESRDESKVSSLNTKNAVKESNDQSTVSSLNAKDTVEESKSDEEEVIQTIIIEDDNHLVDCTEEEVETLEIIPLTPLSAKCTVCSEIISQDAMIEHIKNHFFEPQSCEICNIRFENIKLLQIHQIQEHDLDSEQYFECGQCGSSFRYESFCKMHLETMHAPKKPNRQDNDEAREKEIDNALPKIRKCPVCHEEILSIYYTSHMRKHKDSVVCDVCGLSLKSEKSFRRHMTAKHTSDGLVSFVQCLYCDKTFNTNQSCRFHMLKWHEGEAEQVCETCGKKFYKKIRLRRHIESIHMKLRPFSCQSCNKSFYSRHQLKAHLRQHTNETPFKCKECGEAFKHNVSLRTHRMSKHNIEEEKTFVCKVCGKGFATEIGVSAHMARHLWN